MSFLQAKLSLDKPVFIENIRQSRNLSNTLSQANKLSKIAHTQMEIRARNSQMMKSLFVSKKLMSSWKIKCLNKRRQLMLCFFRDHLMLLKWQLGRWVYLLFQILRSLLRKNQKSWSVIACQLILKVVINWFGLLMRYYSTKIEKWWVSESIFHRWREPVWPVCKVANSMNKTEISLV